MPETPLLQLLISAFQFVSATGTPAASRMVFLCVVCAHGLLELFPGSRPLIYLIGRPGAGKTTLARLVGKVFSGRDWDVTGIPSQERDFWPVIASLHPSVLDNVEDPPRWALDAIARATSGATFRARKLYSDSQIVTLRLASFLWITSYSGGVLRGDLLDRSLIFRIAAPEHRMSEASLLGEVAARRDEALAEVRAVREAVAQMLRTDGIAATGGATERLADFIEVGRAIAFVTRGDEGVALFDAGIASMRVERLVLAMQDPLMSAVIDWALSPDNTDAGGSPGKPVPASFLLDWFAQTMGSGRAFDSTARNVASLGRFLSDLTVKTAGILVIETRIRNGVRHYRITVAADLPAKPPCDQ